VKCTALIRGNSEVDTGIEVGRAVVEETQELQLREYVVKKAQVLQ
jgi:hypothetical protein